MHTNTELSNDLADNFMEAIDMFQIAPKLELNFNEKVIPFKEIDEPNTKEEYLSPSISKHWYLAKEGQGFNEVHEKGGMFSYSKVDRDKPLPTITAHHDGGSYHHTIHRPLTKIENCKGGSYPLDYDFLDLKHKYLIGMSVPPVMVANIATEIYKQWLSNCN